MEPGSPIQPSLTDFSAFWGIDSTATFLNHGSYGACPRPVLEYQRQLQEEVERQPLVFFARRLQPMLDDSRQILSNLLGSTPENLVFVQNATSGVNAVLRSLEFSPGDEILTTSHDYNACRNVANHVAGRSGAKVVAVPIPTSDLSPETIIEAVLAKVTAQTRLVMLDHITSPTALIFPIEAIIRRLAERNIDVLVDGAHAPGMIPLHLERLGAAYYTGNCHKWLCAPKGAGFLYVRPDRQEGIVPPVIGHGYNTPRANRSRFQDLFDWPGTFDPTAWICVGRAIRFLEGLFDGGIPALMRRNHETVINARRMIVDRLGLAPLGPESMLGSMAAFHLPDRIEDRYDVSTTPTPTHWLNGELWEKHRIEVPVYHWPKAPAKLLRISAQVYNRPEQYERLAAVLENYLGRGQ